MMEKEILIAAICKDIIQDPVLIETMKKLFQIANDQGLKGIKLYDLDLMEADETMDHILIKCKIVE